MNSSTVILINTNGMGNAEQTLRHKLISTYLNLLVENGDLPAAICFYAQGVKLVVPGSPVLETLSSLQAKGVYLIICSTCLNHYGLEDQVQVGIIGGMTDILEAQLRAGKVITL